MGADKGREKGQAFLTDAKLEKLWDDLEDVAFEEDERSDLVLAYDWEIYVQGKLIQKFLAGTPRECIWRWFDEKHSKGVAYLMKLV